MISTIYIVTDLGPGDGGKGGIIHSLAKETNASLIIKRGGAQGSHGIKTSDGKTFSFSQWGCGTIDNIPTFLSSQMVISPLAIEQEEKALRERINIPDPYDLLFVDHDCICASPYHRIASQLEELKLGNSPHGTIGSGIGQAYRLDLESLHKLTLFSRDLINEEVVKSKLHGQRDFYRDKYFNLYNQFRDLDLDSDMLESIAIDNDGSELEVPIDDARLFKDNLLLLFEDEYFYFIVEHSLAVGKKLKIRPLRDVLSKYSGVAIVESSHGVLTDAKTGIVPHVSAIRTLPNFTQDMLRIAMFNGRIYNIAVHRAYEIRHGAGPLPTYDRDFTDNMIPNSHKMDNRWQGSVRAGALDINLIKHAIDSCQIKFDGIAITWFDQFLFQTDDKVSNWPICTGYDSERRDSEELVDYLKRVKPIIKDHPFRNSLVDEEAMLKFVSDTLSQYIDIPLWILSTGPTEVEKLYSRNFKGGK